MRNFRWRLGPVTGEHVGQLREDAREQARLLERYGPVAVVTGATSGIGRSCASLLAAAGLDLVIVARDDDSLGNLATELELDAGIDVSIVPADLSTPAGIDMVVTATADLEPDRLIELCEHAVEVRWVGEVPPRLPVGRSWSCGELPNEMAESLAGGPTGTSLPAQVSWERPSPLACLDTSTDLRLGADRSGCPPSRGWRCRR